MNASKTDHERTSPVALRRKRFSPPIAFCTPCIDIRSSLRIRVSLIAVNCEMSLSCAQVHQPTRRFHLSYPIQYNRDRAQARLQIPLRKSLQLPDQDDD